MDIKRVGVFRAVSHKSVTPSRQVCELFATHDLVELKSNNNTLTNSQTVPNKICETRSKPKGI